MGICETMIPALLFLGGGALTKELIGEINVGYPQIAYFLLISFLLYLNFHEKVSILFIEKPCL